MLRFNYCKFRIQTVWNIHLLYHSNYSNIKFDIRFSLILTSYNFSTCTHDCNNLTHTVEVNLNFNSCIISAAQDR